ncbi:MAG: hypothetical protein LBI27_08445 [Clostridiales bacterium]|nr:hypothetical protein [Clostridiales bacterium]
MKRFHIGALLLDTLTVILGISFVFSVIYAYTGQWPWGGNDYNSYAIQARAWLGGRLDVDYYSWLELAVYEGKYYVSFPPFPSFVMLPFAVLFDKTPDHFIAVGSVFIGAFYCLRLLRHFGVRGNEAVFWVLFLFVGSNALVTSFNGWVWHIAQNMAFTFSIISLYYAVKGRGALALAFLVCAAGCRPFQLIYTPLIFYILLRQKKINPFIFLPPLLIGIAYMSLNYARFGSIFEFGHNYLPEFLEAEHGQFGMAYVAENIGRMFRLPQLGENGTLDFYHFDGVAFWLVSPIVVSYLIFYVNGFFKHTDKVLMLCLPLLSAFHIFLFCLHKTLGGWHFGNRYTNDMLPFLFFGLVCLLGVQSEKIKRLQIPLFVFGLVLNVAGIITVYGR